jgi:hypothetical protein
MSELWFGQGKFCAKVQPMLRTFNPIYKKKYKVLVNSKE